MTHILSKSPIPIKRNINYYDFTLRLQWRWVIGDWVKVQSHKKKGNFFKKYLEVRIF